MKTNLSEKVKIESVIKRVDIEITNPTKQDFNL